MWTGMYLSPETFQKFLILLNQSPKWPIRPGLSCLSSSTISYHFLHGLGLHTNCQVQPHPRAFALAVSLLGTLFPLQ